ncbi:MAG: hypothetical protein JSS30_08260 [Verrucomicrobia bacterium]|nr:hypothetical protein [Verrucomicrobiota bacterium]
MNLEKYHHLEKRISLFLKKRAITILRLSMSIIYIWYGALKIVGISPAEELVFRATHWIGTHNFVIILGFFEVLIGLFLGIKKFLKLGLLFLFLQFPGTFLPLFLNPEDCFTIIPFGLTLEGQYIFKNLILISAGLVLIGSLHSEPIRSHE